MGDNKNEKMKTICFFAFIGSENLGDEAIFYSIMRNFKNRDYELIVLSFNPAKTKKLLRDLRLKNLKIVSVRKRREVYRAIKECDVFICGGGGIIQDQTSVYNLPFYLLHVKLAQMLGKKTMFYAVGVGPLQSKISRLLTKKIMNKADVITVRDRKSKKILDECGVKREKITVTADPAVSLGTIPREDTKKILRNEGISLNKRIMIVCLRHWFDIKRYLPVKVVKRFNIQNKKEKIKQERFIGELAHFLDYCKEKEDYQLVFLPFWIKRDNEIHREVISKLRTKKNIFLLNKEYSPKEVRGIIQSADFLVGMRLHSLILNYGSRVPFLALGYSQKVKNYLEMFTTREITIQDTLIDLDGLSSNKILNRFSLLTKKRIKMLIENFWNSNNLMEREKENFELLERLLE